MPPPTMRTKRRERKLTGNVRFRKMEERIGFFASEERVALLVEWSFEQATYQSPVQPNPGDYQMMTEWLPARPIDLCSRALRWLFDHEEE